MEPTTAIVKQKRPGLLHRMSIYGLELFMALFGLVTTLIVVDYGVFALVNYIKGTNDLGSSFGEMTLWVVAAMIVWIPVTILFYLRVKNELTSNPAHEASVLHKVLVSIYYFSVIIGAIGLVFIALYTAIRLAVTPDATVVDTLVRIIVPALIAVVFHLGMLFAFTGSKRPGKAVFSSLFGGVAVAIAVALVIISGGQIRANKQDENAVFDLAAIQSSISSKSTTPASLSDVDQLSTETKNRLSRYTYTKVNDQRYTLCASFATDATLQNGAIDVTPMSSSSSSTSSSSSGGTSSAMYPAYVSFYAHKQGYQCYELQIYPSYLYDKPITTDTVTN